MVHRQLRKVQQHIFSWLHQSPDLEQLLGSAAVNSLAQCSIVFHRAWQGISLEAQAKQLNKAEHMGSLVLRTWSTLGVNVEQKQTF